MSRDPIQDLKFTLDEMKRTTLPPETSELVKEAETALEQLLAQSAEVQEQQRLAALYRVSQTLGDSLNEDEVLKSVMDAVISLTGATRGFLMLRG
jgi:nitrate/nitrite-specific signal transduction histidine kinase